MATATTVQPDFDHCNYYNDGSTHQLLPQLDDENYEGQEEDEGDEEGEVEEEEAEDEKEEEEEEKEEEEKRRRSKK